MPTNWQKYQQWMKTQIKAGLDLAKNLLWEENSDETKMEKRSEMFVGRRSSGFWSERDWKLKTEKTDDTFSLPVLWWKFHSPSHPK